MSLSGLRKQFNKANQYLSETMGAAEATKFDEAYNNMEKRVDLTYDLISALTAATSEYLQPNPATRAKMATMGALSKVRGTTKTANYPQTEFLLAETMQKFGISFGNDSDLGRALVSASEMYRQMADLRYQMEDAVKHNFLDPLAHLQQTDLKEVNHHRTKLKGRRLDYDCKKRKQTRDEELIHAEEKLEESKQLAEQAMYNLLTNDVEQISQLCAFVDAQVDFHRQTLSALENLQSDLRQRVIVAGNKPRVEHLVKPVLADRTPRSRSPQPLNGSAAMSSAPAMAPPSSVYPSSTEGEWSSHASASDLPSQKLAANTNDVSSDRKATAKAIYDFEAQEQGELEFKEGDIIDLISQIDENWYEGSLRGKVGYFPISYVQTLVPL